jgi:hypothetical protein
MCALGDFALFGFAGLRASVLLQRESHCRRTEYNRTLFIWHSVSYFCRGHSVVFEFTR